MDKRVELGDGRTVHVHVDDAAVVDLDAYRPPIESDPDDLDEGATEALILVEPKPSTMTAEGAIAAVGVTARYLWGHDGPAPVQGSWWHDWGKYVAFVVAQIVLFSCLRFL